MPALRRMSGEVKMREMPAGKRTVQENAAGPMILKEMIRDDVLPVNVIDS